MIQKGDFTIYVTKDPSIFKNIKQNRGTDHWTTIYDSIKKNGYKFNPIIVNEKLEIIDGQGRTRALTELGLPHYYIIAAGLNADDVRTLNANQKNWSLLDFVNSYALEQREDYIWLRNALGHYDLPSLTIMTVLGGYGGVNPIKDVKEGHFKVKKYLEAITRLDYFESIMPYFPAMNQGCKNRWFRVVNNLLDYNLIGTDEFKKSLSEYPKQIRLFVKDKDILEQFQEIYNYRKHRCNCKYFTDTYLAMSAQIASKKISATKKAAKERGEL